MSSWILAIDTSTEACSCALGDGTRRYERYTDIPRKHAEKVLPMVEELLQEAGIGRSDISAIAFGRGPGAFTGLRIAASAVQGLAFALDVPVIPVSSLQALAQRGYREHCGEGEHGERGNNQCRILAAIDARMGELYWCAYQPDADNLMSPLMDEQLTAPLAMTTDAAMTAPLISESAGWIGVGTGWQYQTDMPAPLNQFSDVKANVCTHASDILTLALPRFARQEWVTAAQALPVYLRNNVVQKK